MDRAIEPEALEGGVRLRPQARPTMDGGDPRQRMMDVANNGSAALAKEYRLSMVRRLLLRKFPVDQIAQQLGVSTSTIQKDRAEIKKMMREEAKELNIDEMIGNQMFMYDEISAMALRIATQSTGENAAPIPMRLAAMRTTLAANADRSRFLQSAGVFDILRFRAADNGQAQTDIGMVMERTLAMLQGLTTGGDGFEGFNFDQNEPESEEL